MTNVAGKWLAVAWLGWTVAPSCGPVPPRDPVGVGGQGPSGGRFTAQGATVTGGTATGGTYSEPPPNSAKCICALAERLYMPGGYPPVGCTSTDPNDCTLQKAYCGQTCAGDTSCGATCIGTFSGQAFEDAETYVYGSCSVIIRCPLVTP